jgi:hypothetical protein
MTTSLQGGYLSQKLTVLNPLPSHDKQGSQEVGGVEPAAGKLGGSAYIMRIGIDSVHRAPKNAVKDRSRVWCYQRSAPNQFGLHKRSRMMPDGCVALFFGLEM